MLILYLIVTIWAIALLRLPIIISKHICKPTVDPPLPDTIHTGCSDSLRVSIWRYIDISLPSVFISPVWSWKTLWEQTMTHHSYFRVFSSQQSGYSKTKWIYRLLTVHMISLAVLAYIFITLFPSDGRCEVSRDKDSCLAVSWCHWREYKIGDSYLSTCVYQESVSFKTFVLLTSAMIVFHGLIVLLLDFIFVPFLCPSEVDIGLLNKAFNQQMNNESRFRRSTSGEPQSHWRTCLSNPDRLVRLVSSDVIKQRKEITNAIYRCRDVENSSPSYYRSYSGPRKGGSRKVLTWHKRITRQDKKWDEDVGVDHMEDEIKKQRVGLIPSGRNHFDELWSDGEILVAKFFITSWDQSSNAFSSKSSVRLALQKILSHTRTESDHLLSSLRSCSIGSKGLALWYQFIADLLGRQTIEAKVFRASLDIKFRRIAIWSTAWRVASLSGATLINAASLYYIYIRCLERGWKFQLSFVIIAVTYMLVVVFVCETVIAASISYSLPFTVVNKVHAAICVLKSTAEHYCRNDTDIRQYTFNAADYLFVSILMAAEFTSVFESDVILYYRTLLPGVYSSHWADSGKHLVPIFCVIRTMNFLFRTSLTVSVWNLAKYIACLPEYLQRVVVHMIFCTTCVMCCGLVYAIAKHPWVLLILIAGAVFECRVCKCRVSPLSFNNEPEIEMFHNKELPTTSNRDFSMATESPRPVSPSICGSETVDKDENQIGIENDPVSNENGDYMECKANCDRSTHSPIRRSIVKSLSHTLGTTGSRYYPEYDVFTTDASAENSSHRGARKSISNTLRRLSFGATPQLPSATRTNGNGKFNDSFQNMFSTPTIQFPGRHCKVAAEYDNAQNEIREETSRDDNAASVNSARVLEDPYPTSVQKDSQPVDPILHSTPPSPVEQSVTGNQPQCVSLTSKSLPDEEGSETSAFPRPCNVEEAGVFPSIESPELQSVDTKVKQMASTIQSLESTIQYMNDNIGSLHSTIESLTTKLVSALDAKYAGRYSDDHETESKSEQNLDRDGIVPDVQERFTSVCSNNSHPQEEEWVNDYSSTSNEGHPYPHVVSAPHVVGDCPVVRLTSALIEDDTLYVVEDDIESATLGVNIGTDTPEGATDNGPETNKNYDDLLDELNECCRSDNFNIIAQEEPKHLPCGSPVIVPEALFNYKAKQTIETHLKWKEQKEILKCRRNMTLGLHPLEGVDTSGEDAIKAMEDKATEKMERKKARRREKEAKKRKNNEIVRS